MSGLWYRRIFMQSFIRAMLDRVPYIGSLRSQLRAAGMFPAGHYHSPIPTLHDIRARLQARAAGDGFAGIDLRPERQAELLREFSAFYGSLPFPEERTPGVRYYFNQTVFCYADAIFLYSFLRRFQPRRIVEIGSGLSSAVMLDTIDRFFDRPPAVTLIDPAADRLNHVLWPEDWDRVTFHQQPVQQLPLEHFLSLEAGDLLFIDSSHVLKCGSDLQFLMFDVLPRLPVGVFVHFHDVFDGFEYPAQWLLNGMYWNEDYLLRAFLTHNRAWEIVLFGEHMVVRHSDWIAEHMPLCLKNPGGSLYIRRTGD
jgi:hypothetical protein